MAENLVAASGAKHTLPGIGWVAVEEPAHHRWAPLIPQADRLSFGGKQEYAQDT